MARKADSTCPLFLHKASGNWCRQINKRRHYFGKNLDDALAKYYRQKDDLEAGRAPSDDRNVVTIGYATNHLLTRMKKLVADGERSIRTYKDQKAICAFLIDHFGRHRSLDSITPDDFANLRRKMVNKWAPSGLVARIAMVRRVFNSAFKNDLIERQPRFGDGFNIPSKKVREQAKEARPSKFYEADEIRQLLDAATNPHLKAFILMGCNLGYGNADIARIEPRHVDLARGWATYPRGKTGVRRRAKLWDETAQAIEAALAIQKPCKQNGHLLFWTRYGLPWSNPESAACTISRIFVEHAQRVGVHQLGKGFYCLRHVTETMGGEARDPSALHHIMGHTDGMAAEYREKISDERLERIADVIHTWLFKSGGSAK